MVRLYYVHDEACYIVRRANGTPLSFPVWMTQPAAARAEIMHEPCLPIEALIGLRRLITICLSSLAPSEPDGGDEVLSQ